MNSMLVIPYTINMLPQPMANYDYSLGSYALIQSYNECILLFSIYHSYIL